jgi:hypothetical protein
MELCSMKLVRYEERFVVVFLLAAAWRVEVAAVQKKDSWFWSWALSSCVCSDDPPFC